MQSITFRVPRELAVKFAVLVRRVRRERPEVSRSSLLREAIQCLLRKYGK
ncbi:MAG: ribbon-helix-helix domain-containing protein [Nitrospira sp.]|nr:ribbon-helix-helix domain-containing protein [Nitrospira sp.]